MIPEKEKKMSNFARRLIFPATENPLKNQFVIISDNRERGEKWEKN